MGKKKKPRLATNPPRIAIRFAMVLSPLLP
jgi:hypothetical protein